MELVYITFHPRVHVENQRHNQVSDPWYIPAVLTGKPDFVAPVAQVRALRYCQRYMTEHPELRKGRCRLFISFKGNNAGKELCVPLISGWICTTIVDSDASLQSSMKIPGKAKAQEIRAVATSL